MFAALYYDLGSRRGAALSAAEIELLDHIEPGTVAAYLQKTGWSNVRLYNENATIWSKWDASRGGEREVLLPTTKELGDYALRLAETFRGIADFEERPLFDVIADIKSKATPFSADRTWRWQEGLIRFWGLDYYGLSGFGRRTITELCLAAAILTIASLFDFATWFLLFFMLLGLPWLLPALLTGLCFAFAAALYRRSFLVASLSFRGARRLFRASLITALTSFLTLITIQPVALVVFREPIKHIITSNASGRADFFYQLGVLNMLVRSDYTIRTAYYFLIAVVALTTMLPIFFILLFGDAVKAYYRLEWLKEKKEGGPWATTKSTHAN